MKTAHLKSVIAALAVGMHVSAQSPVDKPYVINRAGKKIEGDSIRVNAEGDVILKRGSQPMPFPPGAYIKAVNKTPANWEAAVRALRSGNHSAAIAEFNEIVRREARLGWDEWAMPLLAEAYLSAKQPKEAINAYEELFRKRPELENNADVTWPYLQALYLTGNSEALKKGLSNVIKHAKRSYAAKALLLRGDMRLKEGLKEEALLDYLMVATFFQRQKEVMPEALLKTAKAFEEMKDNRSKTYYALLKEQYPSSKEAREAK